ncbi:unnamed protein product [Mytilus coruscus]|uniref:Uncharacterized protein n=1 Tax=Mytilus coruscus TaxID=42192 RepID=A0A6J8CCP6_MYTCO|nr:unnamed protein product [Mytilus coruscus]
MICQKLQKLSKTLKNPPQNSQALKKLLSYPDSPEKISCNVIEITSSPLHSSPDKYRCISSSSSDDQDHLPVYTTKRRRIFIDLSDSNTRDTTENGKRKYALGKRKRPFSRMSDSSDSDIEIKEEIPWNIDGNCTFRVPYSGFIYEPVGNRHAASAFIGEGSKDTITAFKEHMNELINAEMPKLYNDAYSQMENFIEMSGKQELKR